MIYKETKVGMLTIRPPAATSSHILAIDKPKGLAVPLDRREVEQLVELLKEALA